nr:Bacterial regulatory protein, tetR family [uncultured organism]
MTRNTTESPATGHKTAKGLQRMTELADQALQSLSAHSYARTSLRDIAAAADINLGRLHYYFGDKNELIVFTVRRFKQTFIARLADIILNRHSVEEAIEALVESAMSSTAMHRFWYDLRNQALFEPKYRAVMTEIECDLRAVTGAVLRLIDPERDPEPFQDLAYVTLDGIFFQGIQAVTFGEDGVRERMTEALFAVVLAYRAAGTLVQEVSTPLILDGDGAEQG